MTMLSPFVYILCLILMGVCVIMSAYVLSALADHLIAYNWPNSSHWDDFADEFQEIMGRKAERVDLAACICQDLIILLLLLVFGVGVYIASCWV